MAIIPGKIASFLEQRANVASCGTRDENLVPHGHRVTGWRVGPERETLECFVPEEFTEDLVESLQDNARIAVTIEEFPSHETYQFKGHYLAHRPLAADDLAVHEQCRERFVRSIRTVISLPDSVLRAFILKPHLVLSFKVEEIYLQTPGPGAGSRIVPRQE
jgi:hypothetical protein